MADLDIFEQFEEIFKKVEVSHLTPCRKSSITIEDGPKTTLRM